MVAQSLMKQVDRLMDNDYPDALITALAERLLKTIGNTYKTNIGLKEVKRGACCYALHPRHFARTEKKKIQIGMAYRAY